ncbi:MAG TPA: tetratricopeptide repeat protein [Ktedonobacterales bacterium]
MGQMGQFSLGERLRAIEAEIAAGQTENAMAHCQEVFAHYPRALVVQRILGEAYLAQRQPREALGALDRALAGDPEDVRACCDRAVIHQMHGDPVAALAWYRRACDTHPDDQALRATYREMAARLDRPPYQPSRVGLARLYMRGGQFTHAIREWETLMAENSDLLEAQVGLVETLWRAERPREAEELARRVLMNAPSCVKPMLIVAVIARDTGRIAESERYLQRAEELDPEHRIAHALFADRAMDDTDLRALFWRQAPGYATQPPAPTTSGEQRPTFVPQRATGGPHLTAGLAADQTADMPAAPAPTGRPSLADLSAALSRPDLSANLARPLAQPTRPNNLPPEFHSMFRETANMIWAPDTSDPGAQPTITTPTPQAQTAGPASAAQSAQPPTYQSAASGDITQQRAALDPAAPPPMPPPFEASAQFVPPALADSRDAMGDTEARRAIRWVQWLQAQGARRRSEELARGRRTGSLDALLNTPQPTPPTPANLASAPPPWPFGQPQQPQLPVTSLPNTGPTPAAPHAPPTPALPDSGDLGAPASEVTAAPTGPIAPPKPEDLRQMFAELEPETSQDASQEMSAPPDLRQMFADLEPETNALPAAPAPHAAEPLPVDAQWPAALADALEWPSEPAATPPAPHAAAHSTPDATLEALEDATSASGFQPFELEPGALAAFTGARPADEPSHEATSVLDNFFQAPEEPPLPIVPDEPPAPLPEPEPTYDPQDYPARLAAARALRDAGSLDDALVEYRAILKNSPDLLPDAMSDLEAALEEHPEHPEVHRLLGDARIRQGDYLAALESLNLSVALDQPDGEQDEH